jgi:hypothetical protein
MPAALRSQSRKYTAHGPRRNCSCAGLVLAPACCPFSCQHDQRPGLKTYLASRGGNILARGALLLARRCNFSCQLAGDGDVKSAAISQCSDGRLDVGGALIAGTAISLPQHPPHNGGCQQQQSTSGPHSDAGDGCRR